MSAPACLLLAYSVRRVVDPADAADVVAETYLVAWRRLDDVPGGDEARPWLFGVARRVLANCHRGERRRVALGDRLRDHIFEEVVPALELVEEAPVVLAMRQLPDDDQELLRLVAWKELARDEIAVAMGLSRATVRVRLHRARRRLERLMAELPDESEPDASSAAVQRNSKAGHVSDVRTSVRVSAEETLCPPRGRTWSGGAQTSCAPFEPQTLLLGSTSLALMSKPSRPCERGSP